MIRRSSKRTGIQVAAAANISWRCCEFSACHSKRCQYRILRMKRAGRHQPQGSDFCFSFCKNIHEFVLILKVPIAASRRKMGEQSLLPRLTFTTKISRRPLNQLFCHCYCESIQEKCFIRSSISPTFRNFFRYFRTSACCENYETSRFTRAQTVRQPNRV